jgi:GNAT superfamily N-acetyltransferase
MEDPPVEFRRGDYLVSTDRTRIDPAAALALLQATHWGAGLTRPVLDRAIANSISFGIFLQHRLVGFGRVVSDLATYAYWTDVVIDAAERGQGLGRWLSGCMLAHPALQGLRRVALLTRDAAGLYTGLGFTTGPGPLIYMERVPDPTTSKLPAAALLRPEASPGSSGAVS